MRTLLASLLVCVFTVGCVTGKPLAADKLTKVSPIRVVPPAAPPEPSIYIDQTTATLNFVGSQTGIAGALLFGGIAELNHSAGVRKFSSATAGLSEKVQRTVVNESINGAKSRGLSSGTSAGGSLLLKNVTYGVAHVGKQRFSANVIIAGEIQDSAAKTIWRNVGGGASAQNFTAEEAKASPGIYADAVQEAAVRAAENLASKYSGR